MSKTTAFTALREKNAVKSTWSLKKVKALPNPFTTFCKKYKLNTKTLRNPLQMFVGILFACLLHSYTDSADPLMRKGTWMIITIVLCLEPNLGSSIKKGIMRITGTGFGGLFGWLILVIAESAMGGWNNDTGYTKRAVLCILMPLWCSFCHFMKCTGHRSQDYAYSVASLTAVLVAVGGYYGSSDSNSNKAAAYRVINVSIGVCISTLTSTFFFPIYAGLKAKTKTAKSIILLGELFQDVTMFYTLDKDGDGMVDGSTNVDEDEDGIDDGLQAMFTQARKEEGHVMKTVVAAQKLVNMSAKEVYFTKPHRFPVGKFKSLIGRIQQIFNVAIGMVYPLEAGKADITVCSEHAKEIVAVSAQLANCLDAMAAMTIDEATIDECLGGAIALDSEMMALGAVLKKLQHTSKFSPALGTFSNVCEALGCATRHVLMMYSEWSPEARQKLKALAFENGTIQSKEEQRKFKEAFCVFDSDNSGTITLDELEHVMLDLGHVMTEAELKELVEDVDCGGEGTINYQEFVVLMGKLTSANETGSSLKIALMKTKTGKYKGGHIDIDIKNEHHVTMTD